MSDIENRITDYLFSGGMLNPEAAIHDRVRDLVIDCRAEVARLQRSVIDWKLEAEVHRKRAAAAVAEIARLRAEVERLQADRETAVFQAESDYQHEIDQLRAEVARLRLTDAKPIAWQVTDAYGPIGAAQWMDGETRWPKNQNVPLYLTPPPTLTDAEREAITTASRIAGAVGEDDVKATLRAFLARLGGAS